MGGNRRFRGMKRPASISNSRGYSRLPVMEGNSKYLDGAETRRPNIFWSVLFSLLCIAVLVLSTIVVVKFSVQFSSPTDKDSGESYTSSNFQTDDDGMPSTETVTDEVQGYSSTDFPPTDGLSSSETITDKQAYSSNDFKSHQAQILSSEEVDQITQRIDIDQLLNTELSPLMKTRVPDTLGNEEARQHITSRLQSHNMWTIELDEFQDQTPLGRKKFVNIVATLRPDIKRRLVLACHYDSKYFAPRSDGKVFIGATDSAVPCAMILDLAHNLADLLESTTQVSTSLQLIFFDGEEAFRRWTDSDSLYGARHLAAKMQDTPHPPGSRRTNQLDAMDMFVLLDLIGAPNPTFRNYFSETSSWFNHFQDIETRLKEQGKIQQRTSSYFHTPHSHGGIQDDHIPFVRRGMVRVIHLIASPFPSVWHTMNDNEDALDPPTIDDINKILHVFVVEYLHLLDSQPAHSAA